MSKHKAFSVHTFSDLETANFCPKMYSRLKFGSDEAARSMGTQLAVQYFNSHTDDLIANKVVVISSPYNYIPNAATIMTSHFVNKLNELCVLACGRNVDYSIIHRKVSYTNDYGFLSKAKRKGLIDNDSFYLNREFVQGKLIVFIDDVKITGTHEDKLVELLERDKIESPAHFLYYAQYTGNDPTIEAKLNFAAVSSLEDYLQLSQEQRHHVIIRPIKYLLSQPVKVLADVVQGFAQDTFEKIYHGCLAEGYYKIPNYQSNFAVLVAERERRGLN